MAAIIENSSIKGVAATRPNNATTVKEGAFSAAASRIDSARRELGTAHSFTFSSATASRAVSTDRSVPRFA